MRISIITVVYNNESTIADAIDSVLKQDYDAIEYIVIDGASTDGTMEVVREYGQRITHVVSEPDNGIYDAMNKGLKMATGDVIGILNSDDLYASTHVISQVMQKFKEEDCDCLYGDLLYVSQSDISKKIRYWKSGKQKPFRTGWHPPHPTFFAKKEVYEAHGCFNLNMKVVQVVQEILLHTKSRVGLLLFFDLILIKYHGHVR